MLGLLGVNLVTYVVSALTFSIAFPWLLCWKERWYAEHTYINGRQLYFDGTGMQLIGNWIKWVLLSVITFGIYSLWLPIRVEQWCVKHTSFYDERILNASYEEDSSAFTEWVTKIAGTIATFFKQAWTKVYNWYLEKKGSSEEDVGLLDGEDIDWEARPGTNTWVCDCCMQTNPDSARYCSRCGKIRRILQKTKPKTNLCPYCHIELPADAKFCGNCGQPVNSDTNT